MKSNVRIKMIEKVISAGIPNKGVVMILWDGKSNKGMTLVNELKTRLDKETRVLKSALYETLLDHVKSHSIWIKAEKPIPNVKRDYATQDTIGGISRNIRFVLNKYQESINDLAR